MKEKFVLEMCNFLIEIIYKCIISFFAILWKFVIFDYTVKIKITNYSFALFL